jgi:N,N-dimethylformamidase
LITAGHEEYLRPTQGITPAAQPPTAEHKDLTMKIVGYAARWSAYAGQRLSFFVSCATSEFQVELRRLIHADRNPAGPGTKEEVVDHHLNHRTFVGQVQDIHTGSCMLVEALSGVSDSTLTGAFRATSAKASAQTLISLTDSFGRTFKVTLGPDGLSLLTGPEERRQSAVKGVPLNQWRVFILRLDLTRGVLKFSWRSPYFNPIASDCSLSVEFNPSVDARLAALSFAARGAGQSGSQHIVIEPFNGRLADLRLFVGSEDALELQTSWNTGAACLARPASAWDFAADAGSETVPDVAGGAAPGRTINRPTRLLAGPTFAGQVSSASDAPHLFNAAHFHDDDLSDAGWEESFCFSPPDDLPSGVYAFRLICEGAEDRVPFFVTTRPGHERAPVAVLMPTLSYQAYANISAHPEMLAALGNAFMPLVNSTLPETPEEAYVRENRLRSCYDLHSDGSGVCMATMLRPLVVNVRPGAIFRPTDCPHQLSADLCLIDWLHAKKIPYEVVTDHDLHVRGHAALKPYRAVLTGTHAEYWSSQMLDGLKNYTDDGGRFICLSGNSLYWATAISEDGVLCEVRRNNGVRSWVAASYEVQLSLSGTKGGLWRDHGRAPQRYIGTGFVAQGADVGRPYKRMPASHDRRAAFIFEGVDGESIGDFPALVTRYGAAGMEFDRADERLGTPEHALVLARATGFSDAYQVTVEEVPMMTPFCGGTQSPDCYSDIVFYETPKDGAVFSAPSISWSSALSHNGYENSVSRVTENVVRAFMDPHWRRGSH